MTTTDTTPAIERGATAADHAVMGYTRPDGTYVQGAVNFWDDSVENGALIARDVLAAALDVEEMATEADRHYVSGYDGGNTVCNCGAVVAPGKGPRHIATALRAAILGGAA